MSYLFKLKEDLSHFKLLLEYAPLFELRIIKQIYFQLTTSKPYNCDIYFHSSTLPQKTTQFITSRQLKQNQKDSLCTFIKDKTLKT